MMSSIMGPMIGIVMIISLVLFALEIYKGDKK
jgi:hypothetical protein